MPTSEPDQSSAPGGERWELPPPGRARNEAARWAYRTILLREPESEDAMRQLANAPSAKVMRNLVLLSAEARSQPDYPVAFAMSGDEPAQAIQVDVTPKERAELFARTQAVWRALGETEPHWSVVTAEQFRSSNIAATLDDFFASGETHVGMFMRTLARNGIDASRLKTCMDFGAGVGRLSVALAKRFERVISVDVSASHLQLAREALAQRGIGNATTHVLKTIDAIDRLPACDFIVSVIVLQHNPPPVMRAVLAGLLGRVAPGGVALIQFPTYLPGGYRFDVRDYLAHGGRGMEMHALPQREAFAQIRAAGLEVLEVLEDGWTGYGVGARSNTFVLRRPA